MDMNHEEDARRGGYSPYAARREFNPNHGWSGGCSVGGGDGDGDGDGDQVQVGSQGEGGRYYVDHDGDGTGSCSTPDGILIEDGPPPSTYGGIPVLDDVVPVRSVSALSTLASAASLSSSSSSSLSSASSPVVISTFGNNRSGHTSGGGGGDGDGDGGGSASRRLSPRPPAPQMPHHAAAAAAAAAAVPVPVPVPASAAPPAPLATSRESDAPESLIMQALQIPALARSAVVLLKAMSETRSIGDGDLRRLLSIFDGGGGGGTATAIAAAAATAAAAVSQDAGERHRVFGSTSTSFQRLQQQEQERQEEELQSSSSSPYHRAQRISARSRSRGEGASEGAFSGSALALADDTTTTAAAAAAAAADTDTATAHSHHQHHHHQGLPPPPPPPPPPVPPSDDCVGFNFGLGIGLGVSLGAKLSGSDVGDSLRRLSSAKRGGGTQQLSKVGGSGSGEEKACDRSDGADDNDDDGDDDFEEKNKEDDNDDKYGGNFGDVHAQVMDVAAAAAVAAAEVKKEERQWKHQHQHEQEHRLCRGPQSYSNNSRSVEAFPYLGSLRKEQLKEEEQKKKKKKKTKTREGSSTTKDGEKEFKTATDELNEKGTIKEKEKWDKKEKEKKTLDMRGTIKALQPPPPPPPRLLADKDENNDVDEEEGGKGGGTDNETFQRASEISSAAAAASSSSSSGGERHEEDAKKGGGGGGGGEIEVREKLSIKDEYEGGMGGMDEKIESSRVATANEITGRDEAARTGEKSLKANLAETAPSSSSSAVAIDAAPTSFVNAAPIPDDSVCIATKSRGSDSTLCVRVSVSRRLISGRESHTANMHNFDRMLEKVKAARTPKKRNGGNGNDDDDDVVVDEDDLAAAAAAAADGPFHEGFWLYVRSVLEKAVPVGFDELPDPNAVQPKGPADSAAFLAKFVETSVLNPIHPVVVSSTSGLSMDIVMTELFHAAKVGLLEMKWGPLCERCGSTACASGSLQDLPRRAYCDGCKYLNDVDCLDKIKVIFNLHPDVFYTPMESFVCTPSQASMAANVIFTVVPATSTGSGFRYSAGCGGDLAICPALPPGRYRMHCPVAKTDNFLVVRREATDSDRPIRLRLLVSYLVCQPGRRRKTFIVPHGKIHFDVFADTRSFFVLWVQHDLDDGTLLYLPQEERPPFTTAREVLEQPSFQRLFEDQVEGMVLAALKQIRPADAEEEMDLEVEGGKSASVGGGGRRGRKRRHADAEGKPQRRKITVKGDQLSGGRCTRSIENYF